MKNWSLEDSAKRVTLDLEYTLAWYRSERNTCYVSHYLYIDFYFFLLDGLALGYALGKCVRAYGRYCR
jgi:hypothetical protein